MAGLRTFSPCLFNHFSCISGKRKLQKSLLEQTRKFQLITACLSNTSFASFLQSSSSHELTSRHIRNYSSNTNSVTYYYEVLGIGKNATQKEIKSAYYQLSKRHHPDVSKDPSSQKKFQEISQAYETLGDLNKRRMYDKGTYGSRQYGQDRYGGQGDKGNSGFDENIYTREQREQYMRYRQMKYEYMRDQFTKDRDPGKNNTNRQEFERVYRRNMEELQKQKYREYMDTLSQRERDSVEEMNRPYTEMEKKKMIYRQNFMRRYLVFSFVVWLLVLLFSDGSGGMGGF